MGRLNGGGRDAWGGAYAAAFTLDPSGDVMARKVRLQGRSTRAGRWSVHTRILPRYCSVPDLAAADVDALRAHVPPPLPIPLLLLRGRARGADRPVAQVRRAGARDRPCHCVPATVSALALVEGGTCPGWGTG